MHYLGREVSIDPETTSDDDDPSAQDTVSRLEMTRYMRNQLLRDADVMSMASGVEVRVPFIDGVLFDRVSRIPARQRLEPGKALLRRAIPEIPLWVTNRPKRGFMLPIQRWLDHDWRGTIAEPAPPPAVRLDTWYRRWSVLAFEQWLARVTPRHG
jgi:asparagine synthase (glutamine-hydrolysing)